MGRGTFKTIPFPINVVYLILIIVADADEVFSRVLIAHL
jgi:hypothetical protein